MSSTTQSNSLRYKNYATQLRKYYRMPAVQTSLSVVLSIFIVAFFILVALRPTIVTITELNRTIDESETTLKKLETKAKALQQISNTWEKILPLQQFLENTIPSDGPRYKEFVKSLEIIAYETGVTLSTETLGPALTYSSIIDPYSGMMRDVIEMPVSIRVAGGFLQVKNFFDRLAASDRLVSVESLSFSREVIGSGEGPSISFSISGNIQYLANKKLLTPLIGEEKK